MTPPIIPMPPHTRHPWPGFFGLSHSTSTSGSTLTALFELGPLYSHLLTPLDELGNSVENRVWDSKKIIQLIDQEPNSDVRLAVTEKHLRWDHLHLRKTLQENGVIGSDPVSCIHHARLYIRYAELKASLDDWEEAVPLSTLGLLPTSDHLREEASCVRHYGACSSIEIALKKAKIIWNTPPSLGGGVSSKLQALELLKAFSGRASVFCSNYKVPTPLIEKLERTYAQYRVDYSALQSQSDEKMDE